MPPKKTAKESPATIRVFSSDIDGTLLGKADSAASFTRTWRKLPKEGRPLLVYNTGRMVDDVLRLIKKKHLPEPDYCICGVGVDIYDYQAKELIKEFSTVLEEGWDLKQVELIVHEKIPEAIKQPDHFQSPVKSSWYAGCEQEQLDCLEDALRDCGLEVNIVYSSGRDLDVLPKFANKGNALSWLLKHLGITRSQCLVAGDTGNDNAMFLKRGVRGIIVGNAQPELLERMVGRKEVYRAQGACADGVLEGLKHYGVIKEVDHVEPAETLPSQTPIIQHLLDVEETSAMEEPQRAFIKEGYLRALEGIRKNITPKGFSACSLTDNDTRGTDENYRSVWARDASVTIVGTIGLDDEDIRQCQRASLQTLMDCMSLNGQIPANVSLDTGKPDYSGVGGICSIDSGLWVIIAFAEYVRATQDFELLRAYSKKLQKAMDWLSAQDSNNDALLEIPEAGDWTDLFGRSYHVLVDEVLWFRANIAYGRLMEYLGEWNKAGDYLRWAGTIKKKILRSFWPSLRKAPEREYSFADSQARMGDTSYLLAQVTPFNHDWRCDVFGNALAFLFNVIDHEHAQTAFRFMWGAGVSQPFPAKNLYPAVESGDPSWKSYYTVNLLNLPHHYHNGGIWPLVGGVWVRFLNRLGLKDLAYEQLHELAKINHAGQQYEWEFNEWAHGVTGKPMGKAFQAWSCSEYIAACHEIGLLDDEDG
ncbi:HAD-IIB family hydrolase [Cerasicoccus fimbriatus]|uniref:HAD-IIB family hydrolase n=1 Tax=Cerasicoccus fimbriatus TaxID=3014554 RepID=UPI0022B2D26B|nr:HAD-IIB family hydrolase [Cerasicoccus sp. TK19100]